MTTATTRTIAIAAGLAIAVLSVVAPASAGPTQQVPIARGSLAGLDMRWESEAIPQNLGRPGSALLIDVLDSAGLLQTYAARFVRGDVSRRGVEATEFRPLARPTRAAIIGGATGPRVRKVKVFFRNGPTATARTRPGAPDWGVPYRYFTVGKKLPARLAGRFRATRKIEAYDADGDRISTTRSVAAI